jgi:carboxymethylenebutenolidase
MQSLLRSRLLRRLPALALSAVVLVIGASGCAGTDPDPAREVWTGALDQETFAALHELTDADTPPALGDEITLIDGTNAYLSRAADADAPGLIVIHEWWGLNDHIRHWTDRFAAAGYNAIAVDLYGGVVATTRDGAMAAMGAVDETAATTTLRAAAGYLKSELGVKKYGSIGWCFGGGWSLRTALDQADLDACVIFYGRLVTDPQELAAIKAPILGVFGLRDGSIPNELVDQFEAAARTAGIPSIRIAQYDAEHAFANPSSSRYDASAANSAWSVVREFLTAELQ